MASRDAFVDTSGLYALIDKRDVDHAVAREAVSMRIQFGLAERTEPLRIKRGTSSTLPCRGPTRQAP
jgi:hypothetical protein